MLGELTSRQIVALGRDGLAVPDIAEQLGVEVSLVKLVLEGNSVPGDRDITDDDLSALRRHAVDLALRAENEAIQARMTMYLIDRDKPRAAPAQASPITLINNALIAANQSLKALTDEYAANS